MIVVDVKSSKRNIGDLTGANYKGKEYSDGICFPKAKIQGYSRLELIDKFTREHRCLMSGEIDSQTDLHLKKQSRKVGFRITETPKVFRSLRDLDRLMQEKIQTNGISRQ